MLVYSRGTSNSVSPSLGGGGLFLSLRLPCSRRSRRGRHASKSLSLPCAAPQPPQPSLAVGPRWAFSSRNGSHPQSPPGPSQCLLCSRWWQRPPHWPASSFLPWSHQLFFKTSVYLPKIWCLLYQQNKSRLADSLAGHSEYFVSGPRLPFPICPSLPSFTLSWRPVGSLCSYPHLGLLTLFSPPVCTSVVRAHHAGFSSYTFSGSSG